MTLLLALLTLVVWTSIAGTVTYSELKVARLDEVKRAGADEPPPPSLSVIVAARNEERSVEEALRSLLGVERAEWAGPADLRAGRWNPSILPDHRVVFRIRVVAQVDYVAEEAPIPGDAWEARGVGERPTAMNVMHFASDVGVHPAIVAGRVRFERNNFRLLSQFVGSGEVRRQFFSP
ncbi:hypothetical protein [Candidatus Palauibacter sp.]|uniref:hypothetical protein n=1 Tax=Candidatus Palauibacter sp. TaxID=3101350 RepID=UPI003B52D5FC